MTDKQPRKEVYGKKKEFILNHYDDISSMREKMSARQVANVYGGLITKDDIYKIETILK